MWILNIWHTIELVSYVYSCSLWLRLVHFGSNWFFFDLLVTYISFWFIYVYYFSPLYDVIVMSFPEKITRKKRPSPGCRPMWLPWRRPLAPRRRRPRRPWRIRRAITSPWRRGFPRSCLRGLWMEREVPFSDKMWSFRKVWIMSHTLMHHRLYT